MVDRVERRPTAGTDPKHPISIDESAVGLSEETGTAYEGQHSQRSPRLTKVTCRPLLTAQRAGCLVEHRLSTGCASPDAPDEIAGHASGGVERHTERLTLCK